MKRKHIFLVLLIGIILSGCGKSPSVEPTEDTTDKALLAYREILESAPAVQGEHPQLQDAGFGYEENRALFGEHLDQFALVDLNQDGTEELIASTVINFRWIPICVYTYEDGKVVLLKDPLEEAAHGTFEQNSTANGAYTTYICGENHIHSVWRGATPIGEMEENHAYKLTGTALTAVECSIPEGESTISFFDIAKANTAENLAALGG